MTSPTAQDLPPELLSKIFFFKLRSEQPELDHSKIHIPDYRTWYNVLTVCRYWYNIAIGCPQLWDYISSSLPPTHAQLFLSRSKQVPLRIQPTGSHHQPKVQNAESLRLILNEAHRIQHLCIIITWDVADVLGASHLPLPLPLPMIQYLDIDKRIPDSLPMDDDEQEPATSESPPFPFCNTPHLSTLYIAGYTLGQVKHLFQPTLRRISLLLYDDVEEDDDIPPRIDEICNHLRTMPLLEYIDIPTWLDNEHPLPPRFPVVSLQHLQVLKVQLNIPDASFLRSLTFPPGLKLHLAAQCLDFDAGAFQGVFEHCVVACGFASPVSPGKAVRALQLSQSPHWTFTLKCWTSDAAFDVEGGDVKGTKPAELELDFEYSTGSDMLGVYETVQQCVDVSSIETLSLALAHDQDWWESDAVQTIAESFSNLKNLRVLIAIRWQLDRLYSVLREPLYRKPDPASSRFIFPALKEIYAPHLTLLDKTDPNLHELAGPEVTIYDSMFRFHVWKDNFKDSSSPGVLEELRSQLPAVVIHDSKLRDKD
ncbi:hypothetical protein QCA50_004928 [Cerrena zonata]|uniref:F-box domain-containing protein n=1 Tax=Cerrena zonata TaxID=2478898 RepID=A0AAW0GIA9_9APHY